LIKRTPQADVAAEGQVKPGHRGHTVPNLSATQIAMEAPGQLDDVARRRLPARAT